MGVICVKNVNFASRPFFSKQGNVDDDHLYYDIFGFIQFTVLLPHAVCSLQSAVCSLQSVNVIHRLSSFVAGQGTLVPCVFMCF